ncbi:MAG: LUD domain-containing protein [Muribaculaceae bacterium]|nr:LUD domain-containing protein [Muribaculaceae bacterium]
MSTKKDIIDRCRANIRERLIRPTLTDLNPTVYDDPLEKFISQAQVMGCRVERAKSTDEVDAIIKKVYPDAKIVASSLPYVKSASLNPDTVPDAQALNGVDVGVIRAEFGVAENGSVWVMQKVKERDVCFISENLVAVMPEHVVSNMHEAYGEVSFNDYGYGVFIAGPSKTADIAQVLVMGAQAARSMTLILIPDL